MTAMDQELQREMNYLRLLSTKFPTIQSVCTEIINLKAIMDLPKGTEHFMSDLHGENEAFYHILNNASGVVREKVDKVFGNSMSAAERAELATLIYYPESKLEIAKRQQSDLHEWYRLTLHRLIDVCRWTSSKYTRSKVRKALPADFSYIIDELLHTNYEAKDKEQYYNRIISTIIDIDRADAFIIALAKVIKRLAVDRLHIVGDIFDRGPRADKIMDLLEQHHSVDIQWGNHDILWMGAAAGSEACMANVLTISVRYSNMDMLERGYGISLRHLISFAQETYKDPGCFKPKVVAAQDSSPYNLDLVSRLLKAVAVLQFKLEGQTILRNPEFAMEDRLLLDKIDYTTGTVTVGGTVYPMKDCDFPTVDPQNPYALTAEEEEVVRELRDAFRNSDKLQEHVRFLYSSGGLYTCFNGNLLYHGCIPLEPDGSFSALRWQGEDYRGKALLDLLEKLVRQAYFAPWGSPQKRSCEDMMWYLWCGPKSPFFGRDRMTTFERYFIADKSTWTEPKNPYYHHTEDEEVCREILREFGLDEENSHIINGHVPVKTKDGESPIKASGKLIVIDGGFCKAYQPTTGIAGYTLVANSYGLRLISHEPFLSMQEALEHNTDILSTSTIFEVSKDRIRVADTDIGRDIQEQIDSLTNLLEAYRSGLLKENV